MDEPASIDMEESSFSNFARILLKSFMGTVSIILLFVAKEKLMDNAQFNAVKTLLFILVCTLMLTIMGVMDVYMHNNIFLGMGIAIGMYLFNLNTQVNRE